MAGLSEQDMNCPNIQIKVENESDDDFKISSSDIKIMKELEIKHEKGLVTQKEEAKERRKIAQRNYQKTEAYKEKQKNYRKTEAFKEKQKNYQKTEAYKEYQKNYQKTAAFKEKQKNYQKTAAFKEKQKNYQKTEAFKEKQKNCQKTEAYKEKQKNYKKTEAYKEKQKNYQKTEAYKESVKNYQKTEAYKEKQKNYRIRRKTQIQTAQANHIPERKFIWQGVLEWEVKTSDAQKLPLHIPCQVSTTISNSESQLKGENWPQKLIIKLLPKSLIENFVNAHIENARSVMFHPQECEALESLAQMMSTGYAGCVFFTDLVNPKAYEIKVLMLYNLFYSPGKEGYIGYIPQDQAGFYEKFLTFIQMQNNKQVKQPPDSGVLQIVDVEIRQDEGFKNVSLGNVIPASYKDPNIFFISEADKQLLIRHNTKSFELRVGLHELLGKLFRKNPDGSYNFDMDSVKASLDSGEELSWNEEGETYDSKFSTISSSYEVCRAECVGLYLSLNDDVLKIFGHGGEKAQDIIYVNWLSLLLNGSTTAMEFYNPKTQSWMQAHSQARYVILQVLLEAGQGLVNVAKVIGSDGKDDLLLSLDRSKISTVGKEALGIFLRKLQVYKSTGNVEAARAMYAQYSEVSSTGPYPFAEWRAIILEKKQPKMIIVQSNTLLEGETVKLVEYGSSVSGMIQSWNERYETSSLVHQALEELWVKDQPFFV